MGMTNRIRMAAALAGLHLLKRSGMYDGFWAPWRGDLFEQAEALGLHVMPAHYYSPIPGKVARMRSAAKTHMSGVTHNRDAWLGNANFLIEQHETGIRNLIGGPALGNSRYDARNEAYHPLDAALLYATVCATKPQRVIEIGSGHSSLVIADALRDSGQAQTHFTCIEPHLPAYLRPKPPEISEIIERPLQTLPLQLFTDLEPQDILFIDSTHVASYGSDVVYEILEILPRLKPGVRVHIHDIFLPDDYPEIWMNKHRFFWNEQYLLQAFLCMNDAFRVEISTHPIFDGLSTRAKDSIHADKVGTFPGALWMVRC